MHKHDPDTLFLIDLFGREQVDVRHWYAIKWNKRGIPTRFAFGYFTPDGFFHQGTVKYNPTKGAFKRE